jgi:S1-C subfamily serine protease
LVDGVTLDGRVEVRRESTIELGAGGPRIQLIEGLPAFARPDSTEPRANGQFSAKTPTAWLIVAGLLGIAVFVLFGIIGSTGLGVLLYERHGDNTVSSANDQQHIRQAVGKVIVGVETAESPPRFVPMIEGTAFSITSDGFLLTNRHVVEGVENGEVRQFWDRLRKESAEIPEAARIQVWVAFEGDLYVAKILQVSGEHDMSILKVERHGMPFFRLSSKKVLPDLESVYTFGFPGAADVSLSAEEEKKHIEQIKTSGLNDIKQLFKQRDFTLSAGNGTVAKISVESDGERWIQHNATMSAGNSGGPLCTSDGTVVGINTGGAPAAAGVNFSLMVDQLRREIESATDGAHWRR